MILFLSIVIPSERRKIWTLLNNWNRIVKFMALLFYYKASKYLKQHKFFIKLMFRKLQYNYKRKRYLYLFSSLCFAHNHLESGARIRTHNLLVSSRPWLLALKIDFKSPIFFEKFSGILNVIRLFDHKCKTIRSYSIIFFRVVGGGPGGAARGGRGGGFGKGSNRILWRKFRKKTFY